MVALRRFLVLHEETDTAWCPWWYPIIKAAQYLGTTPWDLLENRSIFWRDVAIKAMSAETGAKKILDQHK